MPRLLLQFSNLFVSFNQLSLFEDTSLSIHENEIFALIGENGTGKTTLLKLLVGKAFPDAGSIHRASHLTIGFLPQEVLPEEPHMSVREYIEEGEFSIIEQKMEDLLENNQLTEWAELHERYEQMGGYQKIPIEKIMKGLNLDITLLEVPMAELSSGQRIQAALAKALIQNPDLLLLDEPTNHLDQESVQWLQSALLMRKGATVVVSHDRKFLNETCNRLVQIKNGHLTCYMGNYDFFLEEMKRQAEEEMRAYEEQEELKKQLRQKIKGITFSRAKPKPPKDRDIMLYDKQGEKHQKSLQRNLDVLKARLDELVENSVPHPKPKGIKGLYFTSEPLASNVAIELESVEKSFRGKPILSSFTKTLLKGDRVILTGPNGAGKTTLLRCVLGQVSIDSGKIRVAPTAKIAYLDQEVEILPMEKTPLEYFEERFQLSEEELRREIHKAAIGGAELIQRPFRTLSVGQRKRLMLLSLILEKPNVLLLDEPTNHLDLLTLEAFEKALLNFEGAILAVSHDAMFIEKIATQAWKLEKV